MQTLRDFCRTVGLDLLGKSFEFNTAQDFEERLAGKTNVAVVLMVYRKRPVIITYDDTSYTFYAAYIGKVKGPDDGGPMLECQIVFLKQDESEDPIFNAHYYPSGWSLSTYPEQPFIAHLAKIPSAYLEFKGGLEVQLVNLKN